MKGAREEDRAFQYLLERGLKPVTRNWRCKGGELDLVMMDGPVLAIVEVRKRSNPLFGTAAESVGARKQARVVLAAQLYLGSHPRFSQSPVRFDVVTLDAADRIEWIKAAFDA